MKKIKKHSDLVALLLIIIGFVVYKFPLLDIPYYWDEAWSYKPALEEMVKNGSTLLPSSTTSETYKGHPLFFYFLSSLWLQVFGNTIFASKLFALFISVLLMITTYFTSKLFTNNKIISIATVLLLAFQSIFIAQSSLVLPEMLLTLLSLLTLFFYFKKNKILYILFGSLVLLTKETGIVLIASIVLSNFILNLSSIKKNFFKYIKNNAYLLLPIVPVLLFFVFQRISAGWFFYPEHINYIEFGDAFYFKLNFFLNLFLFGQDRYIIFLFVTILSIYLIFKRTFVEKNKEISTLLIFIITYILFSSINFFSPRYILSLIPIFTIISIFVINISIQKTVFKYSIIVLILFSSLYNSLTYNEDYDHSVGYENAVYVQQEMINYCEKENLHDKGIATHFLMQVNLTDSIMGYLETGKTFNNVTFEINENTDYVLISSNEFFESLNNSLYKRAYDLEKEYKKDQAWCRLFKIKK